MERDVWECVPAKQAYHAAGVELMDAAIHELEADIDTELRARGNASARDVGGPSEYFQKSALKFSSK